MTNTFTIIGVIFVAAGTGLSFQAIRLVIQRRVFLRDSEVATGVIVALVETRDEDEASCFPTVRFRTATGQVVTFQSGAGTGKADWRVGDPVEVRYRRDRPDSAEVSSFAALWGLALVFAVLGIGFLFVGIAVLAGWIPVSAPR